MMVSIECIFSDLEEWHNVLRQNVYKNRGYREEDNESRMRKSHLAIIHMKYFPVR